MNPANSKVQLSLELTSDQLRYLEDTRKFIADSTGCDVTTESIVLRLMENGLPRFEDDMKRLRSQENQTKRFPRLHLAYNQ